MSCAYCGSDRCGSNGAGGSACGGRRGRGRGRSLVSWLGLLVVLSTLGCPPPAPPKNPVYDDEKETPVEAKQGTACQRAADRLAKLHCKESAPDFAQRCQELVDAKQPICPTRIARIKSCEEIETICR